MAITDFINDYSEVVKSTLAASSTPPEDLKEQMKEALKEVLQELAPPAQRGRNGLRKQVGVYINGARTSLSLRKDLLDGTAAAVGGQKQARQLVEELANAKPSEQSNRSAWVESQLQNRLLLLRAESHLPNPISH